MAESKTIYSNPDPFMEFIIAEENVSYRAQPQHKDRLFRFLFRDKASLLSLYNAVSGTHYTDPELLEINTVDTVLYMKMHNDLSFLIDCRIALYEQQSSWNPNMPLRGLFHFAQLYSAYVESHGLDIYSNYQLKLPFPQYVVFYIGKEPKPEQKKLYLSASFDPVKAATPALECTATVINIRQGHNEKLLADCNRLYEYSFFVSAIQDNLSQGMTLTAAVDAAVERCISNNILKDFLIKQRAEVLDLILTEYNEELHSRTLRQEGIDKMSTLFLRLSDSGRLKDYERAVRDKNYLEKLFEEFDL